MLKLTAFLLLVVLLGVESHVWLFKPISRSSVWRDPAFAHLNPPPNYNDNENNCGRVHQLEIPENCGICGDPESDPLPRPNENGGTYGNAIIVGNYSAGGVRSFYEAKFIQEVYLVSTKSSFNFYPGMADSRGEARLPAHARRLL
jgi:hypothetical protein